MESPLPQDVCFFQGNSNADVIRDYPRGIIRRRADHRHLRTINVSAVCGRWLLSELHFLSHRSVIVNTVGIKFYLHSCRVEIMEIDLNLEYMLLPMSLDLHIAEAECGPFLLHYMPPVDHPASLSPFI